MHVQGRPVRLKFVNKTSITATVHVTEISNTIPTKYLHVSASSWHLTQTMDAIDPSDFSHKRDKLPCNRSVTRGTARRDPMRQPGQLELITGGKLFDLFIAQRTPAVMLVLFLIGQDC